MAAKVVRTVRLIYTDAIGNNNKFWTGILYDDGTCHTSWGRVGFKGESKIYPANIGAKKLESKEREKLRDNYTPVRTIDETGPATIVSHQGNELAKIASAQIKTNSPVLDKLIQYLVDSNVHKITSSTQIKFDKSTGLFSTPLGIVTLDGINEARKWLDIISDRLNKKDAKFIDAVNKYMRIVPQNIGMKFDLNVIFPDDKAIQKQVGILDALESSYAALKAKPVTPSASDDKTQELEKVFSVKLHLVTDTDEIKRVIKKYKDSAKDMHVSSRLEVKTVYSIEIENMAKEFENHKHLGDVRELWHGTKSANVLSILKSGLQVSPPNTASIAGKNFGNGIYFSSISTKSLNYAHGYWDGVYEDNCFMFLAQVAMGKVYIPSGSHESLPRPGYDSTWAKPNKSGVINDEMIVYKNGQCNLTHLVEFQKPGKSK